MRSIEFDEMNVEIADTKENYKTIFARHDKTKDSITCCFQFTEEEIKELNRTSVIWYTQMLNGNDTQPMEMSVDKIDFIK